MQIKNTLAESKLKTGFCEITNWLNTQIKNTLAESNIEPATGEIANWSNIDFPTGAWLTNWNLATTANLPSKPSISVGLFGADITDFQTWCETTHFSYIAADYRYCNTDYISNYDGWAQGQEWDFTFGLANPTALTIYNALLNAETTDSAFDAN